MTTVEVFAPAKVNLTLHITGRRDDGYHLLDSIVAFASIGDRLMVREGDGVSLRVNGPEKAGVPEDGSNLVLQAAELLGAQDKAIELEKNLPSAAGIGGGSADAAAAIRAFGGLPADMADEVLALGADIPMCLASATARVQGIGERVTPLSLPHLFAVLVNPREVVPTAPVFKALTQPDNPPMPGSLPPFGSASDLAGWLRHQRNDLELVALNIAPAISAVLKALEDSPECGLARMSGSGATCFGLYPDSASAAKAAKALRESRPAWWIAACELGDQSHAAQSS